MWGLLLNYSLLKVPFKSGRFLDRNVRIPRGTSKDRITAFDFLNQCAFMSSIR